MGVVQRCLKMWFSPLRHTCNKEYMQQRAAPRSLTEEKKRKRTSNAENKNNSYIVKAVLDRRKSNNKGTEYLVQWEGYEGEDTWEPEKNFTNNIFVAAFEVL